MIRLSLNGRFLTQRTSGVQRVARELITALDGLLVGDAALAEDVEAEIIAPPGASAPEGLQNISFRTGGRLKGQAWEQIDLPGLSRGRTLINLCNLGPWRKRDCFTMIHDAQVFTSPGSYSRAFRTWYSVLQPALGRRHRRILTVSHFSAGELVEHGVAKEDKIAVIHNGADHVLRVEPDRTILERLSLTPASFSLGLANTQVHKNLKVVMQAMQQPELADHKLVLFGPASREDFEGAGITVPESVVFAGFISTEELRALMEAASALVFPSRTEGFGLPPLEAMTLGTPAICAPCGALPEIGERTALFADPDRPEDWAAIIAKLASESGQARADRTTAAKAHASKFTWSAGARRLLEIVQNAQE